MRRFFEVSLLFRSLNVCMLTNFSKMEDVKARGLIKASLLFGKLYVAQVVPSSDELLNLYYFPRKSIV